MASKGEDPPLLPLELDGFFRVGSGAQKTVPREEGQGPGRGRGVPGVAAAAAAPRGPGSPGPSCARSLPRPAAVAGARGLAARSSFLLACRLCFGDTRVFRSPARVERSQALHCSRVTARPAAPVGARSPARLASLSRAALAGLLQAAWSAIYDLATCVTGTQITWATYTSFEAGGCTELGRFSSKCLRPSGSTPPRPCGPENA
ncbi:uncharacterized protein LOC110333618 [Mus pahari]|uniref:uncharacterized protein LOC110333618 n=1 Tax=Mus pahari TaxID=10093 RepID=UPI000A305725|nr:uncharacterized protein LOC110333618 [Mus pahari]